MPLLFESNAHIQGCVWAHPLLLEQNKKGMHACKCFAFNVKGGWGGGEEGEKKRILQKKLIRWEAAQFCSKDANLSHPKKFSSW